MYWPPSVFSATCRQKPHNAAEDFYDEEKKPRTKTSRISGAILGLLLFFGGWNTLATRPMARASDGNIEWIRSLSYCLPGFFAMTLGGIMLWKIISTYKNKASNKSA